MDILTLFIYLIVFFGIAAIIWWAINKLDLPQPFLIAFYVIAAIVAILLLLKLPGLLGARTF